MKYKVVAVIVNLLEDPPTFSETRAELIDTKKNNNFNECNTIRDVEIAYEDYWNYKNSHNRIENPSAKVKVISVEPIPAIQTPLDWYNSHLPT